MDGDPAGMSAHNLNDHDTVMALCCRMEPVDSLGGDIDRRVKSEGKICAGEIIIDCFWAAYEIQPFIFFKQFLQ